MNFIRNVHENCMANWMNVSSSLRRNLRRLSQTLMFVSVHGKQVKKCSFESVMLEAKKARVVLFGEYHNQPSILKAQLCVLERMVTQAEQQQRVQSVALVLEMFNFQQQGLLDAYQKSEISLHELEKEYRGTEGFAITEHYGYLLEAAKNLGVKIIAGFPPKTLCHLIIKKGKELALEKVHELGGPKRDFFIDGSEKHYEVFQGLISGNEEYVTDKYRRIFPAQILKDSTFAYTVLSTLRASDDVRVLGVCGSGHVDFNFGIPERMTGHGPVFVLTSRLKENPLEPKAADFIYLYDSE